MSRAQTNKIYRTFVKGMVTEAGPLTYPENATINEDNCVIYRSGNRTRRLGLDVESNFILSNYGQTVVNFPNVANTTFVWEAVDNTISRNFLVHQSGTFLYFYDLSVTPLSAGLLPFHVDMAAFNILSTSAESIEVSMTSGQGILFVTGETFQPFSVVYNTFYQTVTTNKIFVQIRDFIGMNDGLANDQQIATLSNSHKYNLQNQGWLPPSTTGTGGNVLFFDEFGSQNTYVAGGPNDPIASYFSAESRYPSNSQIWWVAIDTSTGAFSPTILSQFYFGSARAPRGHFVVDAFNIDRGAVSGISGLNPVTIGTRPNSIAFFAGRVFYGLGSNLYYSQTLINANDAVSKAGFCYQEADPTSQYISDLIATDGGQITIPEMGKVIKLVPMGFGLAVFANNGVWFITGTSTGFNATSISVSKVTPIGAYGPHSIVESLGTGNQGFGTQVYWWSPIGIMSIAERMGAFGIIQGAFDQKNLTMDTIQTFYNDQIPEASKPFVRGAFDKATNVIHWIFNDGSIANNNLYNRVLNYDLTLEAFYPWTIGVTNFVGAGNIRGCFITDIFVNPTLSVVPAQEGIGRHEFTKFLLGVYNIVSGSQIYNFTFGYTTNPSFSDWASISPVFNNPGVPYLSFAETGYEILEDAMRDKQANYVFCYFERTENGWLQQSDGSYNLTNQSYCTLQGKWDWSSSNVSNRWSNEIQAYRLTRVPSPIGGDSFEFFDNGDAVVYTKNKIRGNGKSLQLRFENGQVGSGFNLYGWAVNYSGNTAP